VVRPEILRYHTVQYTSTLTTVSGVSTVERHSHLQPRSLQLRSVLNGVVSSVANSYWIARVSLKFCRLSMEVM